MLTNRNELDGMEGPSHEMESDLDRMGEVVWGSGTAGRGQEDDDF